MAKEVPGSDQGKQAPANTPQEKKPMMSKKVIMYGVPIFLVQVVVVYFLTIKFILPMSAGQPPVDATQPAEDSRSEEHDNGEGAGEGASEDPEKQIYVVKDLIINPAGTNGTRFLLTTVGFQFSDPQARANVEKREIQVRDMLNTILSSKGLEDLVNVQTRDSLRSEIASKVGPLVKGGKLTNVFFSKFIIQ